MCAAWRPRLMPHEQCPQNDPVRPAQRRTPRHPHRLQLPHDTCFETFPFPQQVTVHQADAIRQQMIQLNDYRNTWMADNQKGITELYNRYFDEPASKLRKLHDALDALVLKAYGWSPKDDVLANLLDLNLELAELEADGRAIVGPWDPSQGRP